MEKELMKQKRKLGLSDGILLISAYAVSILLSFIVGKMNILNDSNKYIILYVINAVSLYGVGFPMLKLLLRKVEVAEPQEKKKLGIGKFLIIFVVMVGATQFVNFVTQIILMIIQALTGCFSSNIRRANDERHFNEAFKGVWR